jgi:hypothetical protein
VVVPEFRHEFGARVRVARIRDGLAGVFRVGASDQGLLTSPPKHKHKCGGGQGESPVPPYTRGIVSLLST